jgi:MbtH protein
MSVDKDDTIFVALVNDEGQYSLWPKSKSVPGGWSVTDIEGSREACSAAIDEVWTDMRPKSLRASQA